MRKILQVLLSLALAGALAPVCAYATSSDLASDEPFELPTDSDAYEEGELIVTLADGADAAALSDELVEMGRPTADVDEVAPDEDGSDIVKVSLGDEASLEEVAAELVHLDEVASVQPNYTYHLLEGEALPQDPYLYRQTYLKDGNLYGARVTEAWESARCDGNVTVAVLDTGITAQNIGGTDVITHEDLAANVLTEYMRDMTINSPRGRMTNSGGNPNGDPSGHGTHVAGIISAQADNNIGIAGASYNAKLIPLKVFTTQGLIASTETLVKSYKYLLTLVDEGAVSDLRVINMSLGSYEAGDKDEALHSLIKQARYQYGIVSVCAGGNGYTSDDEAAGLGRAGTPRTDPLYPGDFDECVSVTALNTSGGNASFSDYNMSKDISAAGERIYSTYPSTIRQSYSDGDPDYEMLSGTSMATPLVSGVFALLWAADPGLSVAGALNAVYSTAREVNDSVRDRRTTSGSHGAIDAAAAVEYVYDHIGEELPVRFADVSESSWYHDVVYEAVGMGLVGGYETTPPTFGPNGKITRGQVATILWRAAGSPSEKPAGFSDVKAGAYYADAVNWAAGSGVVTGYVSGSSKTFRPNADITRQDLTLMLARYVAGEGASGSDAWKALKGSNKVNGYARGAIAWGVDNGVIGSSGDINPQGSATRAEATKMLLVGVKLMKA